MPNAYYSRDQKIAERRMYANKVASARANLIIIFAFTIINIILLATGSFNYFLISASIPYYIANLGMLVCGKYPPEIYADGLEGTKILEPSAFPIFLVIALLISLVYLLLWIFSKKKTDFCLKLALVAIILDTLGMFVLMGISFDSIINIIFHVYIIWSLFTGIKANKSLLALPADEIVMEEGEGYITVDPVAPTAEEAAAEEPDSVQTPADEISTNTEE